MKIKIKNDMKIGINKDISSRERIIKFSKLLLLGLVIFNIVLIFLPSDLTPAERGGIFGVNLTKIGLFLAGVLIAESFYKKKSNKYK